LGFLCCSKKKWIQAECFRISDENEKLLNQIKSASMCYDEGIGEENEVDEDDDIDDDDFVDEQQEVMLEQTLSNGDVYSATFQSVEQGFVSCRSFLLVL